MKKIKGMHYLEGVALEVREEKNTLENNGNTGDPTKAAFVLGEDGKNLYGKQNAYYEFGEERDGNFQALNELITEFEANFGGYDEGVLFFQEAFAPFFEMNVKETKIELLEENPLGKDFRCMCGDHIFDFHSSKLSKDFIVSTEKDGMLLTYQLVESPSNAYLKTIMLSEKIHELN